MIVVYIAFTISANCLHYFTIHDPSSLCITLAFSVPSPDPASPDKRQSTSDCSGQYRQHCCERSVPFSPPVSFHEIRQRRRYTFRGVRENRKVSCGCCRNSDRFLIELHFCIISIIFKILF